MEKALGPILGQKARVYKPVEVGEKKAAGGGGGSGAAGAAGAAAPADAQFSKTRKAEEDVM